MQIEPIERAAFEQLHVDMGPSDRTGNFVPGQLWLEEFDGRTYLRQCWHARGQDPPPQHFATVLSQFVRIASDPIPADAVLAFAKSFGTLEICDHGEYPGQYGRGLPDCYWCIKVLGDMAPPLFGGSLLPQMCVDPKDTSGIHPVEPIEGWVSYARRLASILQVLEGAQNGAAQSSIDPAVVDAALGTAMAEEWGADSNASLWEVLERAIYEWIHGEMAPTLNFRYREGEPCLLPQMDGPGLLGILTMQLLTAAKTPKSAYICNCCGKPYTVNPGPDERRPQTGRKHYCQTCRADNHLIVQRIAARERYALDHPDPQRASRYRAKTAPKRGAQP